MKTILAILIFALSSFVLAQETEKKPYLGVLMAEVSPALQTHLNLEAKKGLMVQKVVKASPAAEAGLKAYDILLKVNGEDLVAGEALSDTINKFKIGDELMLEFIRGGEAGSAQVVLGETHEQLSMDELKERIRLKPDDIQGGDVDDIRVDLFKDMDEDFKRLRKQMMDMHRRRLGNSGNIDDKLQQMLERIARQPQGPNNFQFKGSTSSMMSSSDRVHRIQVKVQDGHKTAVVTDMKGNKIFDGPINTDEEINKIPEGVRAKVMKIGKLKIKKEFH